MRLAVETGYEARLGSLHVVMLTALSRIYYLHLEYTFFDHDNRLTFR